MSRLTAFTRQWSLRNAMTKSMRSNSVVPGALVILAVATAVMYWLSASVGYPIWAFMTELFDRFGDFVNPFVNELPGSHAYFSPLIFKIYPGFSQVNAPATVLEMLWLGHLPLYDALRLFFITTTAISGIFLFRLSGRRTSVTILLLLAHPYLFAIARANQDMLCLAIIAAAYWAILRDHDLAAALCIGLAAAFKLPYAMFFLLLLPRRRFKELICGGGVLIAGGLLPLFFTGYGVLSQIRIFSQINTNYSGAYIIGDSSAPVNYSAFGATKFIAHVLDPGAMTSFINTKALASTLIGWYTPLAVIGVAAVVIWVLRRPESLERAYLMIACSLIIFPFVSGPYRLIFLLPAIARYGASNEWMHSKIEWAIFALLLLIMFPKDFPWSHYVTIPTGEVGAMLWNPLLIAVVMVLTVVRMRHDAAVPENVFVDLRSRWQRRRAMQQVTAPQYESAPGRT